MRSLAECYLYREHGTVYPYAVIVDDEVVGFLLLDLDLEEGNYMIWRMMIDANHQGKGFGRQVVEQVIEMARQDGRFQCVLADYVEGNDVMKVLLERLDFVETRFRPEYNEYEMRYYFE